MFKFLGANSHWKFKVTKNSHVVFKCLYIICRGHHFSSQEIVTKVETWMNIFTSKNTKYNWIQEKEIDWVSSQTGQRNTTVVCIQIGSGQEVPKVVLVVATVWILILKVNDKNVLYIYTYLTVHVLQNTIPTFQTNPRGCRSRLLLFFIVVVSPIGLLFHIGDHHP